jgi:hypothetical protein
MSYDRIPEDMRARIHASRANFGRAGIGVRIDDDPDGPGVILIMRQDPDRLRPLSVSQLRERGEKIVQDLPVPTRIDVDAGQKFHVQPHPTSGALIFRRLIGREYDATIKPGGGTYAFEVSGKTYHLEPCPGAEDVNLSNAAKKADRIIIQQELFEMLPR